MNLDKTGNCVIFRSAERTFTTAECTFTTAVCTFRTAERNSFALCIYIYIGYSL
ncbi:MAG: hypothetical protein PUI49_09585 [Prevotellaceae bacterium]|nr:hypothetical protein [Prevotellaceae bacterium]